MRTRRTVTQTSETRRHAGRRLLRWIAGLGLAAAGTLALPPVVVDALTDGPSACRGTAADGSLENGVRLSGGGARAYCWICTRALRTYGLDRAVEVVDAAYAEVVASHPGTD